MGCKKEYLVGRKIKLGWKRIHGKMFMAIILQ